MDSIERAIRDALAKGDAEDRTYREKVYRSILAALERANAADDKLTPEGIARRQDALKAHITAIEQEYIPAVEPANGPSVASQAGAAPEVSAAPEPRVEKPIRNEPAQPRHAPPQPDIGAVADDRLALEGEHGTGRRRRRPYALMFVAVTFVAALAIGAWWAAETGLFGRPDDGSVPNPPPELEEEDFTPEPPAAGGPAAPRDWITLFDPADPSTASAPSGATVDPIEDDDGTYLAIRSGAGGAAVLFNIPADVLQQLAGGSAVFDVVARSEEGEETQISITCNFGELGDCGRKRYIVGYEQADYLFEIDLPRGSPGADGTIAIVADVSNEGRALHIFGIRVSRR